VEVPVDPEVQHQVMLVEMAAIMEAVEGLGGLVERVILAIRVVMEQTELLLLRGLLRQRQ
jgi:hypothetical protein